MPFCTYLTDLVSFALEGPTKLILVLGREEDEQKARFFRLPRPLLEPGFGLNVVGSPLAACRVHLLHHRLHRRRVHPRGEAGVDLRTRCRRGALRVVRRVVRAMPALACAALLDVHALELVEDGVHDAGCVAHVPVHCVRRKTPVRWRRVDG